MNIGFNPMGHVLKQLITLTIFCISLTSCVKLQDPSKEPNLSKTPIGVHVEQVGYRAGMTFADITIRNNSGHFINSLYIEIYPYNNDERVGMANYIFNSVNINETMVIRLPINSSGREWNGWRSSYKTY